jgi:pyrimidine and pyridine-specific 5'-nucleotidase
MLVSCCFFVVAESQVHVLRDSSPAISSTTHTHQLLGSGVDGLCVCGGKKKKGYWSGYRDDEEFDNAVARLG